MSVTCLFQYTGIRIFNDHTCEQRIICSTRSVYIFLEKKTPFSPNIIFYYITAPHLNKKYVAPGRQNLAGEFCVVGGEFSDLRCLMNTLVIFYQLLKLKVLLASFRNVAKPTFPPLLLNLIFRRWQLKYTKTFCSPARSTAPHRTIFTQHHV